VRNHIIDFLITRSRNFLATAQNYDPRHVPVIKPAFAEPAIAATGKTGASRAASA
jgi:nitrate/nitrite transport system ATP-binding protein